MKWVQSLKVLDREHKYIIMVTLFVTAAVLSCVISAKVVKFGPLGFVAGGIPYALSFTCMTVILECYGRARFWPTIWLGFLACMVTVGVVHLAIALPASPRWPHQEAYEKVLNGTLRLFLAGQASFWISKWADKKMFGKLREATKNNPSGFYLWVRDDGSVITAQFVDTVVFVTVAFAGILPVDVLLRIFAGQFLIKMIVNVCDYPFVWLAVRWIGRKPDGPA